MQRSGTWGNVTSECPERVEHAAYATVFDGPDGIVPAVPTSGDVGYKYTTVSDGSHIRSHETHIARCGNDTSQEPEPVKRAIEACKPSGHRGYRVSVAHSRGLKLVFPVHPRFRFAPRGATLCRCSAAKHYGNSGFDPSAKADGNSPEKVSAFELPLPLGNGSDHLKLKGFSPIAALPLYSRGRQKSR